MPTVKACGPLRTDSLLPSLFSRPFTTAHYICAASFQFFLTIIWCNFAKVALPMTPSQEFTSLLPSSWTIHIKHRMSLLYALKIFLCVENRKIYKLASRIGQYIREWNIITILEWDLYGLNSYNKLIFAFQEYLLRSKILGPSNVMQTNVSSQVCKPICRVAPWWGTEEFIPSLLVALFISSILSTPWYSFQGKKYNYFSLAFSSIRRFWTVCFINSEWHIGSVGNKNPCFASLECYLMQ